MANVVEVIFRGVDQITRNTQQMSRSMALMQRTAVRLGGAITAAFSVREVVRMADAMTAIENRIRLVTESTEELNQVQDALFDIAQDTRSQFEGVARLYGRAAIAADELNATQEELLAFTRLVGEGLAIEGGAAGQATGALFQLSQALGSGIVRAEEFNSILEGAFPIAQAAARGIDEAGGSVAKLRQLVIEGEITSREFFEGLLSQADEMAETFDETESTVGQALTRLRNSTLNMIDTLDDATGASSDLAEAIITLSEAMDIAAQEGTPLNQVLQGLLTVSLLLIPGVGQLVGAMKLFGDEANRTGGTMADYIKQMEAAAASTEQANTAVSEAIRRNAELAQQFQAVQAAMDSFFANTERLVELPEIELLDPQAVEDAQESVSEWGTFVEGVTQQAAANIQTTLANFLFDPFEEGLDGMLAGFIDVIRRMVAEAAAAKLIDALFGGDEDSGGLGGFLQDIFKGVFGQGRAHGGLTIPGVIHPVNEREPEFLLTRGRSEVVPLSKAAASGIRGNGSVFAPTTTFQLMTAPLSREALEEFTQSREDIMFARFKQMLRDDGID